MSDDQNRNEPVISTRVLRKQIEAFDELAESLGLSRAGLLHEVVLEVLEKVEPKRYWKYLAVDAVFSEELEQQLAKLDMEGWELVSVHPLQIGLRAWVKRRQYLSHIRRKIHNA